MESTTHGPDWNRSNKESSRRKCANHPRIQRSGSKLEVLPPEDIETILCPTNSTVQTLIDSEASPRLTQSAGSDGRRSRTEELRSSTPPIQRSSSEGRLTPGQNDHTPRKQIVLPTVKRNFERHGLPKDGIISINSIEQQNCNSALYQKSGGKHDPVPNGAEGGEMPKAEELLSKLKLKMTEEAGERLEHNRKSERADAGKNVSGSRQVVDSYYISHTPSLQPSEETLPSGSNSEGSIVPTEPLGDTAGKEERQDDSSSGSSDESDDEEDEKAPFELMGEFLEAVMDEDYETADKLCKMIMMYEPDNSECKQFQPLIEEMLKREREAQLWGSDDSDDDEDEDDSEDTDDDDEEEESDEDSGSSSEESTEESSVESEEEKEEGQR